ncbi:antibiotic biosynthesis monooxygenase [Breoghania sp.]|uniref:putative quinol monooxygenase n=1 Tax=Breoghania sp. TaxID=2065378 RepID=UPI002AA8EDA4|nr:antibiotic biosynthesis monooxygenase [Breoghania sp.]
MTDETLDMASDTPDLVTIVFTLNTHPETRADLVAELDNVSRLTREQEEGCLAYDYYLTDGSQSELLVRQVWTTMEAYKVHNLKPYVSQMFARYELTFIEPVHRLVLKPAFEHVVL